MAWIPTNGVVLLPNAQDGQTVAVRAVRDGQPGPEATVRISVAGPLGTGLQITNPDYGTRALSDNFEHSLVVTGAADPILILEADWLPLQIDTDSAYPSVRGVVQ